MNGSQSPSPSPPPNSTYPGPIKMQFQETIEINENDTERTADVQTDGSFESLMISKSTRELLKRHGYLKPSPVQQKAIPTGLTGLDMLVQAKSGTGKTLVFAVLAVENINVQANVPQKMIIAPTREIATQIKETVKKIKPNQTRVEVFVGGVPLSQDMQVLKKNPQIIIGTTGRIRQLIQNNWLNMDNIDFFVLDEADKLMEECFVTDINYLFSALPKARQVAVFSATYPNKLDETLSKYMKDVALVRFNADDVQLIGIKQYVCQAYDRPVLDSLEQLLKSVIFNQVLVFCNNYTDCEATRDRVASSGFEAAFIYSQMPQTERDRVIEKLKANKIKVLVSTDLTARGIDAESVNLVVNLETPIDTATYFHRIGRAARYGGLGASVTLISDAKNMSCFTAMACAGGIRAKRVTLKALPPDITTNQSFYDSCRSFWVKNKLESSSSVAKKPIYGAVDLDKRNEKKEMVFESWPPNFVPCVKTKNSYKYDRKTLLKLDDKVYMTTELNKRLLSLQIAKTTDVSDDIGALMKDMKQLKEASKATGAKPKPIEEPPKKYKFVPSREKSKKKFYMRGELLSVRNSFTDAAWRQYAATKFNLSAEPFCTEKVVTEEAPAATTNKTTRVMLKETRSIGSEEIRKTSTPPPLEVKKSFNNNNNNKQQKVQKQRYDAPNEGSKEGSKKIIKYSRYNLIRIQMSHNKETWEKYVRSKWNTSEEPFEMDQNMRCSVEQQIRRRRLKEKLQRDKVIQERKKAAEEAPKLIACSRYVTRMEIKETNFDDYVNRLQREFEAMDFEAEKNKQRYGPVVPMRDSEAVWRKRIAYYSQWLDNLDSQSDYATKQQAKRVQEASTETDFADGLDVAVPPKHVTTAPSTSQPAANTTQHIEGVGNISADADLNESSGYGNTLKEAPKAENSQRQRSVEHGYENRSDAVNTQTCAEYADEDFEPPEQESSNYNEPEGPPDSTTWNQNAEEREDDVVEEEPGNGQEEHVQRLQQFADTYRRNVDFNVVFNTYLSLMNNHFKR